MTDDIKAIRDALAKRPSPSLALPAPEDAHPDWHYIASVHPERIARLLDALEQAQKDAARLDWLDGNPDSLRRSAGYLGSASSWTVRDADGIAHDFISARAAIDAARSSAPQSPPADRAAGDFVSNPQR